MNESVSYATFDDPATQGCIQGVFGSDRFAITSWAYESMVDGLRHDVFRMRAARKARASTRPKSVSGDDDIRRTQWRPAAQRGLPGHSPGIPWVEPMMKGICPLLVR